MESTSFSFSSRDEKKRFVRRMFGEIARTYDVLNHTLSLGLDFYWRRAAIRRVRHHTQSTASPTVLDIACGTGDLTFEILKQIPGARVTGVDLAEPMLERFRSKLSKRGLSAQVEEGDVEALRFSDASFEAVTIGFGTRNFTSLEQAFQEIHRVLKPGGMFVNLELAKPRVFPLKQLYRIYFEQLLPFVAGKLSRHDSAYRYLPDSLRRFPDLEALRDTISMAGFDTSTYEVLTGGVVAVHVGIKKVE